MKWSFIPRAFTLACSALLLGNFAQASTMDCPAPKPFEARYYSEIDHYVTLKGEAVQTLKIDSGGAYKFDFNVDSMIADLRESVAFEWDDQQCLVIFSRYHQSLEGRLIPDRKTEFQNFPSENAVRGHYRGDSFTTDSKDRYVDPLGLQIQVRQDLKAGKTNMKYYMVHKGKVLIDKYQVVGNEQFELNSTTYDTVKLEKVRPESSDRETYMWMAPELDYALIRLIHKDSDGERYEVIMTDHTFIK